MRYDPLVFYFSRLIWPLYLIFIFSSGFLNSWTPVKNSSWSCSSLSSTLWYYSRGGDLMFLADKRWLVSAGSLRRGERKPAPRLLIPFIHSYNKPFAGFLAIFGTAVIRSEEQFQDDSSDRNSSLQEQVTNEKWYNLNNRLVNKGENTGQLPNSCRCVLNINLCLQHPPK